MQPVVELKARIAQIRNIERGESVGMRDRTARRPTRLAIVSAAMPTDISAPAAVTTAPARDVMVAANAAGGSRISMDLMAVDITDLP